MHRTRYLSFLLAAAVLAGCGSAAPAASPSAAPPSQAAAPAAASAKPAASAGASAKPAASGAAGANAKPAASGAAAASAKPAGSGAAAAKPVANGAVNLGYVSPASPFLWEIVAYKQGLFDKYGLKVNEPVFVGGTPRLGAALVGGTFDAAGVGFAAAIDANAAGAHLEAIASQSKVSGFMLILPPGSPIKSVADLKGKTIAVSQIGDSADEFLTTLLTKNGLSRDKDVKVTQTSSTPNTLTQTMAKAVDAGSVSSTYAFSARAKGGTILATARELNMQDLGGPVLVRKDWAESHRDQVLSLMKGMLAANAMYRANEQQGLQVMKASGWFNDVTPDVLSAIWQDDKQWNLDLPLVGDAEAKSLVDLEKERDPKVAKMDPTSLYDNSYLQELVKDGFMKSVFPDFKG
jgi:NitT/TauT family transport system substrate-binding protein